MAERSADGRKRSWLAAKNRPARKLTVKMAGNLAIGNIANDNDKFNDEEAHQIH